MPDDFKNTGSLNPPSDQESHDDSDEDLLSSFEAISKALAELGDTTPAPDDNAFEYPLAKVIELLPRHYIIDSNEDVVAGQAVVISLQDLFDQLARGKVTMPLSKLAYFVPASLLYDAIFNDSTEVQLNLPLVVRAISTDAFAKHMPPRSEKYIIDGLDDPFEAFGREELSVAEAREAITLEDEEEEIESEEPATAQTAEAVTLEDQEDAGVNQQDKVTAIPQAPELVAPEQATEADRAPEPDPVTEPVTESVAQPISEPVAPPMSSGDTSFAYPLPDLLALIPPAHVQSSDVSDKAATIVLDLPDLFDQLSRGKVSIALSIIAEAVPTECLAKETLTNTDTKIDLSLRHVVESVGPERLAARITGEFRSYDIDRLVDPFEEPDDLPRKIIKKRKQQSRSPNARQFAAMVQRPSLAEAVSETHGTSAAARKHAKGVDSELNFHELPGNININAASMDELQALKGVTRERAAEIIAYREAHGEFKSIFELQHIPGINKTSFRRITGMTATTKQYHRRRRLSGLLAIEPDKITNLDLVAGQLVKKPGFSGCIISDSDGLVLAQHGTEKLCEEIAAIIPRMMRRIGEDMKLIGAGRVGTVSIAIDGVLYTIAASRNVALTAVHDEHHVSETDLAFIRKTQKELAWLLSLRAYVGPTS